MLFINIHAVIRGRVQILELREAAQIQGTGSFQYEADVVLLAKVTALVRVRRIVEGYWEVRLVEGGFEYSATHVSIDEAFQSVLTTWDALNAPAS